MPTPLDHAPLDHALAETGAGAGGEAEITLRDAVDGDGQGLIALIGRCFADYPDCVLAVDAEMPELRAVATRHVASGGRFWVAEAAGRIVGSVGLKPAARGDGVELVKLYVAPQARRRGLGGRLVGLVEAQARARRAAWVELWSDTRFAEAHRLYRRLGFAQRPGRRDLFDLSHSREYHFVKPLLPSAAP